MVNRSWIFVLPTALLSIPTSSNGQSTSSRGKRMHKEGGTPENPCGYSRLHVVRLSAKPGKSTLPDDPKRSVCQST